MTTAALVARDDEIASLRSALDKARAGEGSLVLLSGDAGVGKSALASALAEQAGVTVLRGAAAQTRTEPHGPLVAALRSYLHAVPAGLDGCGPLRSHLAVVLPELGDAVDGDRATLFEAFRCALVTVTQRGPALMVLDDLHWSDEATLDVLAALAPHLRDLPILVIAAYRADEFPAATPSAACAPSCGARARSKSWPSTRWIATPARPSPHASRGAALPALAAVVHDRTQGLPFFVEELVTPSSPAG